MSPANYYTIRNMENKDSKAKETAPEITPAATPETTTPEVGKFLLKKPGPFLTMYNLHLKNKKGKKYILNHDSKPLEFDGDTIPVATQAKLKEVYDSEASYVKIIEAPAGYKAPWFGK